MASCWARPATGSWWRARSIRGCCDARRSDPLQYKEGPMYAVPDVDEVVAVARELGIHLSPEEAVMYQKFLLEQLGQLDAFVQARVEEPRPPMVSPSRKPGWRPSPKEHPLNDWIL